MAKKANNADINWKQSEAEAGGSVSRAVMGIMVKTDQILAYMFQHEGMHPELIKAIREADDEGKQQILACLGQSLLLCYNSIGLACAPDLSHPNVSKVVLATLEKVNNSENSNN